jgi:nucleotide-binding universal stress UspA family protein
MFKNVLVGVDGRPNGRDAIALAKRLTDDSGTLTLAHVYSGELNPSHAISPGLVREEQDASAKLLEDELAAAGLDAELVSIVAMSPGRGLHQQAEDQGADLLVVGSCSRGAFGRAMLGDDTRAALNGAPCAVAIAPVGYATHRPPLERIGVGYNGSPEGRGALEMARELAASLGATVHAREVVSIPSVAYTGFIPPLLGDSMNELLQDAQGRMSALTDVNGSAVYGLTGEELASFSEEVDLLVVGSRSYGPVKRLVIGSTSNYLERRARCSLLVLPRPHASETEQSEHAAAGTGVAA